MNDDIKSRRRRRRRRSRWCYPLPYPLPKSFRNLKMAKKKSRGLGKVTQHVTMGRKCVFHSTFRAVHSFIHSFKHSFHSYVIRVLGSSWLKMENRNWILFRDEKRKKFSWQEVCSVCLSIYLTQSFPFYCHHFAQIARSSLPHFLLHLACLFLHQVLGFNCCHCTALFIDFPTSHLSK